MKVLIIKTSSLGDIIHTLPAITDAGQAIKNIKFDWLIEKNYQEIAALHPVVETIIPVALRSWRKRPFSKNTFTEIRQAYNLIKHKKYDYIIDAQGLLKSAILSLFVNGKRYTFDQNSAREPWVSFMYHQRFRVSKDQHAIVRLRQLFASVLSYSYQEHTVDYGLQRSVFSDGDAKEDYIVLLHGTTWPTKHWPEAYWQELASIIINQGLNLKLIWGNNKEFIRAHKISQLSEKIQVMTKLNLIEIAKLLAQAKGVIAVDTGLSHLSAALSIPTVTLYGPTNPQLTGTVGNFQAHLKAHSPPCAPCLKRSCQFPEKKYSFPPCFASITPHHVWQQLQAMIYGNG